MNAQNTGSKYALIIGLPTALALCILALPVSNFYPVAYVLKLASLKIFWNPLVWAILVATITIALWQSGKAIARSLAKRDVIKTSLYFTFLVNVRLLIITAAIYFGGILHDWIFSVREIFLPAIPYSIISMLAFFTVSTALFAATVSLLIVKLTKSKIETLSETPVPEVKPGEVKTTNENI
jgi:hypothetical protein